MMSNSTETFTDKLKRQQEEQAQELLNHARQTLMPLKTDITTLCGDVRNSIKKDTASIRRLLKQNLIYRWWFYPLTATIFLAVLILPGVWMGGKLINGHLQAEITEQLTEIHKNEERLETMKPWGIVPKVTEDTGQRYLLLPKDSPKPELRENDAGYRFVMLGVYDETKEE